MAEASERLVHTDYDLLLLDERVDGRSGLQLLRELRRQRRVLPLVFLTGHHGQIEALSAQAASETGLSGPPWPDEFRFAQSLRCALCQRQREKQSRQAEDQLRKLSRAVEQSADLVIITDRQGTIEYVNPAFENLTGYSRDEVLGCKPSLLKSGEQGPVFYQQLWETILSGGVFRGVLVNRKRNGDTFCAEKTITPVRDASGNITHFISNDRDITERRRLEAQLLQSQRMDAIGQLAGGIAHDFNNLLMIVSSQAELALSSLGSEHPLRHNLDEILKASLRAAGLTRQLLTFGRRQVQPLRVLDLNSVLQELSTMLQRLIGEDIQCTLNLEPALGRIKADPVHMEQVIFNLAANARDAMPDGGQLTITTSNVHLDAAYLQRRPIVPPGDYVLLTVADSGRGIPPEHLPHIFEPFFTTKEADKGTGLGLATVYGIVKRSGGYIWAYSEPGLGATFKIYLQSVDAVAADTVELASTAVEPLRGSETLLFVEDEEAVRQPACEFLEGCGYRVLQARDGHDALQIARAHDSLIHLVVTDVVMPHMNGNQLAEELSRERPELRVLYLSGYASPGLLQRGVSGSETMFLEKPFTLKMLAAKVRQALSAPRHGAPGSYVPIRTSFPSFSRKWPPRQ
jgi:PAS domain S-box-containing protein